MLVAIRENEQRARFIGYPADRYKLFAFTASAAITALAGALSVFNHRFASAEPLSVQFSGELLAMGHDVASIHRATLDKDDLETDLQERLKGLAKTVGKVCKAITREQQHWKAHPDKWPRVGTKRA